MRAAAPSLPCAEFIDGQRFTWIERTPLLRRLIAHAATTMEAGLAAQPGAFRIDTSEPLVLDERTTVIPDLIVAVDGRPRLVVEYRSESTARYVLGPKRLLYGRAGLPEFWFVDPRGGEVLTMTVAPGSADYEWPARRHGAGERLDSHAVPSLHIGVDDLIGGP